jgi:hypothetical protein
LSSYVLQSFPSEQSHHWKAVAAHHPVSHSCPVIIGKQLLLTIRSVTVARTISTVYFNSNAGLDFSEEDFPAVSSLKGMPLSPCHDRPV